MQTTKPSSTQKIDLRHRPLPPCSARRDDLVRQGLPRVRPIAERLRRGYGLAAAFADQCAMGFMGMAVAVGRIDATKGPSFVTFSYHKIRSGILDGLRRSDRRLRAGVPMREAAWRMRSVLRRRRSLAG